MLTDTLQIELLKHAPTFRRQVSAALLSVGLERWKGITATLVVLEQTAAKGELTPEQAVQLTLAQAEKYFLSMTLDKQGVTLIGTSYGMGMPAPDRPRAEQEIDRLIDQLFNRPDWKWTVADWLENQSMAQQYINGQILALLVAVAAPSVL